MDLFLTVEIYIAREKLRSLLLRWKAYNAGGIKNAFHVKNRTKKPHGVPDRVSFVLDSKISEKNIQKKSTGTDEKNPDADCV